MRSSRIIGSFEGKPGGPLLICLGGIHGNEVAGIKAIETVLPLLEREAVINPDFAFHGTVVGLCGNLQAIDAGVRFLQKDLNRIWTLPHIQRIKARPVAELEAEDLELRELIDLIEQLLATYQPPSLYIIDLHTTSAGGGIFTVATDDPESIRIGVALHAPVIKGLLNGLEGTALHYLTIDNTGIPTTGVSFESGQHDDPLSVNRAIAALINCLEIIGCIPEGSVENRYDELLRRYSEGLPKVAELVTSHPVHPGDQFRMQPGYANFQPISRGEELAHDARGPITAIDDGLILMPLYQPQGSDGFFIVRQLNA